MKQKNKYALRIIRIIMTVGLMAILSGTYGPMLSASAKPTFETAPMNPSFTEYMQSVKSQNSSEKRLGYVPAPWSMPDVRSEVAAAATLPSSFDLRDSGRVTSVKDQGESGSCWAFATYGSMESYLYSEMPDFSENNLKNKHGFDLDPNTDGGNSLMAIAYLARWGGPVSEAEDPYNPASTTSPTFQPQKHVQEAIFLDGTLTSIKNSLYQNGALAAGFYWNEANYKAATYSYYTSAASTPNHGITIVGWDDNYAATNFKTTAPGNGAFIVKNSWSDTWGESGYFYISYYDVTLESFVAFHNAEATDNYDNNYSYDPLGLSGFLGVESNSLMAANVFKSVASESLEAVSFYTPVPGSAYTVRIYTDPASAPNSGSLKATKSGTMTDAGYHTLKLDLPVSLNAGQKYSVVLTLTTPGYDYPIAMEYPIADYSSLAVANPGESFLSADGTAWTDCTAITANANVCIKAFTSKVLKTDATLSNLAISSGTLTPSFATGTTSYTASVANSTSTIKVTPTVNQANATIKVNGTTVASGSASGDIALAVGSNMINVVVTAQDGTTIKTYSVAVTRAAAEVKDFSGIYNIRSKNSSLVMDVYGGGKDQGVNVIQWPYHGRENQQWKVEKLENGYYKITSVLSGLSIDVYGGGTDLGNRVIQWPYHGGTNQQWKLIENADGTVSIMSRLAEESGTGYLLDVYGGGKDQGVNVIQWTAHYGDNQKWYLDKVSEYTLTYETNGGSAVASAQVGVQRLLTEPTSPTKAGSVFGGWYKDAALTQKWDFTKDRMPASNLTLYAKWEKDYSGIYNIRSKNSELVMDVYGGGTTEGTNIIQWTYHGRSNQQWTFASLGNGYYKITSVLNPQYSLDVYGGGTDLGNRVIQWTYHGGTNQQWKIIENADGTVSLMSRLAEESGTGYLLDVLGGGKDQGVNVIQWTAHFGDNQKWYLDAVK